RVDPKLLTQIRERIRSIQVDALAMNQESLAECLYQRKWYNPFPKFKYTERPDTAAYPVPTECPNCGSTEIMGRGFGTEKIEDQIAEIFPEAKIARMDLDTTRTRNAYERLIADFSEGRTNLLIGTQMVSKGLDFDKVSVVGILNADSMLNYPDFRAYEHAFMMMAQVSGRAGRKGKRGLVILQTKNPTLPVIGQVVHNDYEGLYQGILEERRTFHYPTFF
ncbi:primosomal protein N', partial [human gut metagenome]